MTKPELEEYRRFVEFLKDARAIASVFIPLMGMVVAFLLPVVDRSASLVATALLTAPAFYLAYAKFWRGNGLTTCRRAWATLCMAGLLGTVHVLLFDVLPATTIPTALPRLTAYAMAILYGSGFAFLTRAFVLFRVCSASARTSGSG